VNDFGVLLGQNVRRRPAKQEPDMPAGLEELETFASTVVHAGELDTHVPADMRHWRVQGDGTVEILAQPDLDLTQFLQVALDAHEVVPRLLAMMKGIPRQTRIYFHLRFLLSRANQPTQCSAFRQRQRRRQLVDAETGAKVAAGTSGASTRSAFDRRQRQLVQAATRKAVAAGISGAALSWDQYFERLGDAQTGAFEWKSPC
jgi:hypothetical protein